MRSGFSYDDREVLEGNPAVSGALPWSDLFLRDYWDHSPAGPAGHYRPTAVATLRLDHALHGASPLGCHLSSLLLHAAVLLLAVALFRARGKEPPWRGLLLFAIHPVLADSVAWISGRTSMVCAIGGLLGAWIVALAARKQLPLGVMVAAALSVLLALLGKEDGIVFGPLAILLAWEVGRKYALFAAVGSALGLAGYLFMRHTALGEWFPSSPHAPLADAELFERLSYATAAAWEGLRVLAAPIHYPTTWEAVDLESVHVAFRVLAVLLLALAAGYALTRRSDSARGVGLALLAVLPFTQLVPTGVLLAPRFLYLPLLFLAPGIQSLSRRVEDSHFFPAALLLFVPLAWSASGTYDSRRSYWQERLDWRATPQAWNALGNAYLEEGLAAQADTSWHQAMALDPNYSRPIVNLATSAMRAKDWETAEQWLEQAVKVGPKNPVAWANLGRVRHELEKGQGSEAAWKRATELSPRAPLFWQQLGRVRFEMLGDEAGARQALERAQELDPKDEKTRDLLDSLPE